MLLKNKYLPIAAAAIIVLSTIAFVFFHNGCVSTHALMAINNELILAQDELNELAAMAAEDPELYEALNQTRLVIQQVQLALQAYIDSGATEPSNVIEACQWALDATQPFVTSWVSDTELKKKIQLGIFVIRAVLRRIEVYCLNAPGG